MSQFDFGVIDPNVKTGTQLAADLNQWRTAVHSTHAGAARPAYALPGMLWVDQVSATDWKLKLASATGDTVIGAMNPSTNLPVPAKFPDGTLAAPGISWINEPSAGFLRVSNQVFQYAIANQPILGIALNTFSTGAAVDFIAGRNATVTGNATVSGNLQVNGIGNFAGAVGVGGGATITGLLTTNGGISCAAGVAATFSGGTVIGTTGHLSVPNGNITCGGQISCTGAAGFVGPSAQINGTLNATGNGGVGNFSVSRSSTYLVTQVTAQGGMPTAASNLHQSALLIASARADVPMAGLAFKSFSDTYAVLTFVSGGFYWGIEGSAGPVGGWAANLDNTGMTAAAFTPSDVALKENIEPIGSGSLAALLKLKGVRFTHKRDKRKGIGLVAQNVRGVYPEAVGVLKPPPDDVEILTIEYGALTAPIIEAIRELAARVVTLEGKPE